MKKTYICDKCYKEIWGGEAYEYRGGFACEEHFDELQASRNTQRAEIVEESKHLTEKFRGLDMGDGSIGRANREILKADIEIASKETGREKEYRASPNEI